MKKTIIRLILVVLFVLPTVVALMNCHHVRTSPPSQKDVLSITIEDTAGKTVTYDRVKDGDKADEAIGLFYRINKKATPLEALPDGILGETPYKVIMSTGAKEGEYRYYFSTDPNVCYYSAPNGKSYQLGPDNAAEFLSSEFAGCYYENSGLPTLLLSGSMEIAPQSATWKFRDFRGEFVDVDLTDVLAEGKQSFDGNVFLSLSFKNDVVPDSSHVTITDEEKIVLFDDSLDQLAAFPLDSQMKVHIEVTATWFEDAERGWCGDANYVFDALISPPPVFSVSRTDAVPGSFITVTAKNVNDPAGVTFTSEPDIGYTPQFFADGATVKALIPFDMTLPAGSYTLTFTYAGVSRPSTVVLGEQYYGEGTLEAVGDTVTAAYSEEARQELEGLVTEMAAVAHPERKFDGVFLASPNEEAWHNIFRTYGMAVYVNGDTNMTFINNGIDYNYGWSAPVGAVNAGTVVYTGELAYTGKIVVVEHGYGLKTWYYNLSEVTVSVGDAVETGDQLGVCGSSGFADFADNAGNGGGVHMAMSVGNRFVDPTVTWAEGVTFVSMD